MFLKKLFYFIITTILLGIIISGCSPETNQNLNPTKLGKTLNKILMNVEFGVTTKQDLEKSLCEKFHSWEEMDDENLAQISLDQFLTFVDADLNRAYNCTTKNFGDIKPNYAVAFVLDKNDILQAVDYYASGYDVYVQGIKYCDEDEYNNNCCQSDYYCIESILDTFGKPTISFYRKFNEIKGMPNYGSLIFAYPEKGVEISILVFAIDGHSNSLNDPNSFILPKSSHSERIYMFKPMKVNDYRIQYMGEDYFEINWEISNEN